MNTVRRPSSAAMVESQRASSPVISVKPLPPVATVSSWLACTISAMSEHSPPLRPRAVMVAARPHDDKALTRSLP